MTEPAAPAVSAGRRLPEHLRFPGCHPLPLPRDEFEDFDFEEKIEHWDARTETAWAAEMPGVAHEGTSRRLAQLASGIGLARGSTIGALGSVGLVERDAGGAPVRMMQPDQTLYLHPERTVFPTGMLVIGEHDLPDVVLEVDYTTDIRPGKQLVYEAWGIPELWAVAPEGASFRRPGATILRLVGGRYRPAAASAALPGWTAAEIHAALAERVSSARTDRVVERVGRTLGEREGTRPDDVPLIRLLAAKARAKGYAAGYEAGRTTGYEAGRAAELAAAVHDVLQARGIRPTDPLLAESDLFAGVSPEAVTAAALACPDGNLPLVRSLTAEARVEGYAAGYAEGYTTEYEAGRAAERVAAVRGVFQVRGIRLTDSLLAGSNPFAGASRQAVMAAAVTCADEADFRRRLGLPPR